MWVTTPITLHIFSYNVFRMSDLTCNDDVCLTFVQKHPRRLFKLMINNNI